MIVQEEGFGSQQRYDLMHILLLLSTWVKIGSPDCLVAGEVL